MFNDIHAEMCQGLREDLFTAGSVSIADSDNIIFEDHVGFLGSSLPVPTGPDTLFDLASLTKVFCTMPLCILLQQNNCDFLDTSLKHWFNGVSEEKARITISHLLAHCSGLRAWRPYYLMDLGSSPRKRCSELILGEDLEYQPGTQYVYSDLGFILLAEILEKEFSLPLDTAVNEHLFDPLGLKGEILFNPWTNNVAVTREGDRIGAVNDLNTRALGGVSGHAGLFGTTRAVQKIGREYLKGFKGASHIFMRHIMDQFFSVADYIPESGRALGMDTPARTGSSAGSLISAKAVGHTGFTGVSLWIDLDRGISMVLLTNRVIRGEPDMRIKDFRPRIHDMLIRTFDVIRGGDQI